MAEENTTDAATDAPTGAETEAKVEEGFGSAFAERASASEKETPAGEQPATSEPAPAGSEAAPSSEAAGATPAEPTPQAFDPWAGLTPEQKAHFERLQASERSQRGRVGALTKKLNLTAKTAPAPSAAPKEEQPAEGAESEPATAADLEARLAKVADEYGDVNGPVVEAIRDIQAQIAELKPKVDQVDLDKDAAEIATARAALEEKHPDVAVIEADPDFTAWAEKQPAKVQELLGSFDPDEVSLGLSLYKAERKATQPAAEAGGEGNNGSTATGDRRARQLDGSRQVPNKGAPAATGVPDEFGAAFKARAATAPA